MIRVTVAGGAGRMARMIVAALATRKDCAVRGAFEYPGNSAVGQDVGVLAGIGALGVLVTDDPVSLLKEADVLVDFTIPEAAVKHAALCAASGTALVLGTTGLGAVEKKALADAATRIPVVFSPNMSVGVNLLFKLAEQVAAVLGSDYDIEIVEAHHRLKKDSPSGTAARLLEVTARGRGLDPAQAGVYGRQGMVGPRQPGEIGVMAVRAGDIVGDHTVLYAGPGERIEITHRAHSREVFARGAVRAALWVVGREPGLYDMADVLGLADPTSRT